VGLDTIFIKLAARVRTASREGKRGVWGFGFFDRAGGGKERKRGGGKTKDLHIKRIRH